MVLLGLLGILGVRLYLSSSSSYRSCDLFHPCMTEIVMVRLQGDFAKPPEKRFNYKHCFDALFRVRLSDSHLLPLSRILPALSDDVTTCTA